MGVIVRVTIGIRVSKEAYERWKRLDEGTKRFIREVFERMVLAGGALPVEVEERVIVVAAGKEAGEPEAVVRRALNEPQKGVTAGSVGRRRVAKGP